MLKIRKRTSQDIVLNYRGKSLRYLGIAVFFVCNVGKGFENMYHKKYIIPGVYGSSLSKAIIFSIPFIETKIK
jgi:hypothetical protein